MSQRGRQTGFTLIEIMMVVIIVGVLVTVTVLSVGVVKDDRDMTKEAQRFIALVGVARDDAAMQGREFGMEIMTAGFRYVEYDALTATWADVPGDEILRLRELPEELQFELFLEGKQIRLEDDPAVFDDPEKASSNQLSNRYSPHLYIFSSGDATPFELHLFRNSDDARVVLRGNALGMLEIIDADEI